MHCLSGLHVHTRRNHALAVQTYSAFSQGELQSLPQKETDTQRQRLRLLKAHELLADLSDDNREQFADVVRALRAELGERG